MRSIWTDWLPLALSGLLAIYSIYLGFRITDLEDALARQRYDAGADAAGAKDGAAGTAAGPGHAPRLDPLDPKVEARLKTIEDDLSHMQEEYAQLDEQLAGQGGNGVDERRILDVVTRAQERVRDRQLEFHGTHWRKTRAALLDDFATKVQLEPKQTDALQRLLEEETDAMIELIARPESAENPERTAAEWQRRLDETDQEALRVLTPEQIHAWLGARAFERQVLWPWLPSLQAQR